MQPPHTAGRTYEVERRAYHAARPGFRIAEMQIGPTQTVRYDAFHCAVMPAALMIGHHFSISALWNARRNSGVCSSREPIS